MKSFFAKSILTAFILTAFCSSTALAAGPDGFAAMNGSVTGGAGGRTVTVTNGVQLQAAIASLKTVPGPLTIYVAGPITLANSNVDQFVIDGHNNISIIGTGNGADFAGISIKLYRGASNIIIQNLRIHEVHAGDADAIGIDGASRNIWIDHNEFYGSLSVDKNYYDGLFDTKRDARFITVSYNYFHDHHKATLNGYADSDAGDRFITYHHNIFENIGSRVPLIRFGYAHVYDNYYRNILVSGINSRMDAKVRVENNVFENVANPVCSMDSSRIGYWDIKNNILSGTTKWSNSGGAIAGPAMQSTTQYKPPYGYVMDNTSCLLTILRQTAGVGKNGAVSDGRCGTVSVSSTGVVTGGGDTTGTGTATGTGTGAGTGTGTTTGSGTTNTGNAGANTPALGNGDFPDGFTKCAEQNQVCKVKRGTGVVAFGAKGKWLFKKVPVGASLACTPNIFGGIPSPDRVQKCSYHN